MVPGLVSICCRRLSKSRVRLHGDGLKSGSRPGGCEERADLAGLEVVCVQGIAFAFVALCKRAWDGGIGDCGLERWVV